VLRTLAVAGGKESGRWGGILVCHGAGTPDGVADSQHEWRDSMRMAANDGIGAALDMGSLS
jgi:hypothetical protein